MFSVFDDDHSGELDEDEFCGAMELTGGQGGMYRTYLPGPPQCAGLGPGAGP